MKTMFQLAKRGLNIILVSRTLSKLEDVAKEISQTFNVQTQVIAVNFTSGTEIYDQIKQQIAGKEIGILINNVGMFQPAPELLLDIPNRDKVIHDIIGCNITSVPMMCSLLLPQMVQRKRGLIINISSLASVFPGPTIAIYAASKAFVSKFSNDLAAEYESQGITVQVLVTGEVGKKDIVINCLNKSQLKRVMSFLATNMNKKEGGTFTVPTASQYVESTLSYVGYARQTTGFLPHSLLAITAQLMNFIAPSFVEGLVKKEMLAVREKAIKRGSYKPENLR